MSHSLNAEEAYFSLRDVVLEVAVEREALQLGLGQDGSDVDHLVQRQRQSLERSRPVLLQRTAIPSLHIQSLAGLVYECANDDCFPRTNEN